MNRTDRLLAIVLTLQGRGRARAEDLARSLDVSKRTIYRDVLALNEAGVPIVSAPGQGYTLMDGYFLPPLRFSVNEAIMLMLGSDVVTASFDAELASAAQQAARKISAVLSEEVRGDVAFLRDNLRLVQRDPNGEDTQRKLLVLREAIVRRQGVRFQYHKRHARPEERRADPHALFRLNTAWMLSAFDHARGALRTFRLEHLDDLTLTGQHFERQPGFQLRRDEAREARDTVVRVLFAAEVARWVRQTPSYFVTELQDTPGGLLVTLRVRNVEDVLAWLLSWGGAARVLEPAALQTRLRQEAGRILDHYR
ncbi:YafY family protein [Deinococcus sonorensis]|uniref:YafY family protein n=2 Tax=Deinococcus sonorensis TaxID=309891 RepID=A0AAU7UCQ1_9DEIO